MAITTFTNGVTLTDEEWFNHVDTITYDGATTQILVGGGAGTIAAWTTDTGSGSPVRGTSPAFTTSITTASTTFTALAGATTLLTIGGTGATAVFAIPGTLEASGTTGALTVAGGMYVAKAVNIAGNAAVSTIITKNSRINVKHPTYGAIGDGITDDTIAINLAFTTAETSKDLVYIP